MKNRLLLPLVLLVLLCSCNKEEPKEDVVNTVPHHQSIETEVSVKHADSVDILQTKHKVWVKGKLAKEMTTYDTIPALGDTLISSEDRNGNTVTGKTKKDYEFYITVQ